MMHPRPLQLYLQTALDGVSLQSQHLRTASVTSGDIVLLADTDSETVGRRAW